MNTDAASPYTARDGLPESMAWVPGFAAEDHPENCIGEWADEKHLQNGECYCDCPACTSPDGERCICVDCDTKRCPDHDS